MATKRQIVMNPFHGVLPAILTPFYNEAADEIDHRLLSAEAARLCQSGCNGVVWPGSMGEGLALTFDEKVAGWSAIAREIGRSRNFQGILIAAIAAPSTAEAVKLAKAAKRRGAGGLMVLPPVGCSPTMVREVLTHIAAVMNATTLPSMVYNNPPAYRADLGPAEYAELQKMVQPGRFAAVKESHPDVARIFTLRQQLPTEVNVLVGLDGNVLTGVLNGAVGWVAGLPVALSGPCLRLWQFAVEVARGTGQHPGTLKLFSALKPLFDLDARADLVQCFKHCMGLAGIDGFEHARAPRLPLGSDVRELVEAAGGHFKRHGEHLCGGL